MFSWIRQILIGKYLKTGLQWLVAAAVGFLVSYGIATKDEAQKIEDALNQVVPKVVEKLQEETKSK